MTLDTSTLSPMMAQWQACKNEAGDALLLFRLGDFYEAFFEDAKTIAKDLSLTLTARQEVPMCGVPFFAAENYIDKLIAKGHKIAIAEQMEDPRVVKGLIKRQITRMITPGTIISSALLSDKKNNFFASVAQIGKVFGLSYLDITTGEFSALELEEEKDLLDELGRLRPTEFLTSKNFLEHHPRFFEELSNVFAFVLNQKENMAQERCLETLSSHFGGHFGLQGQSAAIHAAGTLLLHLKETLSFKLEQITSIQSKTLSQFMTIDRTTERHLELTEPLLEGGMTLLSFLDETLTPMGGRLLANWLKRPLLSVLEIEKRQNAVAFFLAKSEISEKVREFLKEVRDLERLITKILAKMASPRDVYALGKSLSFLPALKKIVKDVSEEIAKEIQTIFDADVLSQKIVNALNESPPLRVGDGDIFREGFHPELDRLRKLTKDSISWMIQYQNRLREETGIKTLKVGYTKAFGYYIEVSRAQSDKVPPSFQRRQTLVNAERFLTEELKQFEYQVLTAEERAKILEADLFETLRLEVASDAPSILHASKTIARLDVFLSFAKTAKERNLVRPLIDTSDKLEIVDGRHPIVEKAIGKNSFIANDTFLDSKCQMMLITGPNMAGKSTYIRQVALLIILAQVGSFIPAAKAHIGLVDKVFSRIGASDDLSRGQSTFMVEMSETAQILQNATSRSFVLLDEIGRGTSTYDGISIAAAVVEFLLTETNKQAKTLFATHYWELTRLEKEYPNLKNFQTAVKELPSGIVFLRKIIEGGTDKSYGIHVAKLAGLPFKVIRSAEVRLKELETKRPKKEKKDEQLPLFSNEHPIEPVAKLHDCEKSMILSRFAKDEQSLSGPADGGLPKRAGEEVEAQNGSKGRFFASKSFATGSILEELKSLDCNQMTPLQALQKLIEWKNAL